MTQMFEITYVLTGSGANKKLGQVYICICDEKKNGEKAKEQARATYPNPEDGEYTLIDDVIIMRGSTKQL